MAREIGHIENTEEWGKMPYTCSIELVYFLFINNSINRLHDRAREIGDMENKEEGTKCLIHVVQNCCISFLHQ
jgi:hypothetical protein